MTLSDPQFRTLAARIAAVSGIHVPLEKRWLLSARVEDRVKETGEPDAARYVERVMSVDGQAELGLLVEALRVGETQFFRHASQLRAIRRVALPEIVARREGEPGGAIKVWSAGCATGEEPYTLAMLFAEAGLSCLIEATDIDPAALQRAAHGYYPDAALIELPKDLRERYITRSDGFYEVSPVLRGQVRFSMHDILSSRPPPGAGVFDLVCFRNLLIYLGHEVQDLALHSVRRAVRHEGYLCLGEAEWVAPAIATTLSPLAHDTRIFRAH
jgi:chemotaxis methyl-accepting protein methylase